MCTEVGISKVPLGLSPVGGCGFEICSGSTGGSKEVVCRSGICRNKKWYMYTYRIQDTSTL